mgnify:CR=1 FL=1
MCSGREQAFQTIRPSAFLTTQLCDDWCFYHLYVRKISLLKMH